MGHYGEVTLDRAFINLVSDPSQFVDCGTAGSVGGGGQRLDAASRDGNFRSYASGRVRLILGTATTRIETIVLRALTPAQVALIQSWIGQTVLLRDTYGRRIYGSYLDPQITDIPLSGRAGTDLQSDVLLDFQQVTFAEGV